MKILMASSEFSPFASTGDLGVQVRTLAVELQKLGHEISVVLPFYRSIQESKIDARSSGVEFQISLGGKRASAEVLEITSTDRIQVFFVRRDEYFDRSGIYGGNGRPYEDNSERFIFFSRAVVELARRLSPAPEIIHSHDWTTALVPIFVQERQLPFRTVLTIHNLEHQGSFWSFDFALTSLAGSYFGPHGVEFYGRLNLLKGGILFADALTLPGEAALFEAFTPARGYGLDAVLQENHFRTFGIPHGVDYSKTNPPLEKLLPHFAGTESPAGKARGREALLDRFGLEKEVKGLILTLPIDQTDANAFDAVAPILDLILTDDTCAVVTGAVPESNLADTIVAERKYPTRFAYRFDADTELKQLALAGADVVLFPGSLGYRGQTVVSALRYGALPIARARPGIDQLVADYDPVAETGHGFVYHHRSPYALWDSIQRVKQIYQQPKQWIKLVDRAKAVDFSWSQSAAAFAKVYANLLRHRQPTTA